MGVAHSNQSGIQLRESNDRDPQQWFVRLPLCVDDPCNVQGLHIAFERLGGDVCGEDLVCVVVSEGDGDARIRQPNLHSMVSSRRGMK